MKKTIKIGTIILIIFTLSACFKNETIVKKEENNLNQSNETINKAEEILNNMTLDEKIGQMFIIDYRESSMNEEFKDILETIKPGGFIFFDENFTNYEESLNLISEITNTANIPMFLSIDQEGGRVQRLKSMPGIDITTIPPMTNIGSTNDEELAYNTGITIANDLKKFNLNMDFAPVLDIYSNPQNTVIGNRSFGNNAELVTKMGLSLGNSLKDNNIIPVYKHFPGHGDTEKDSHIELPIIYKTKSELLNNEIIPFKAAIENNAEVIMIGHLAIPNLTNDYIPASLSKIIITDFLKKELGYNNLVITDALNMKAITNNYQEEEIYNLAINAGVDILLMPENPISAFNTIKNCLNNGTINEEQINNSVKKIIELKLKYNIIENS